MRAGLIKLGIRTAGYIRDELPLFSILHAEYEWRKTRNAFIAEQPICQMCGDTKDLQVHHLFPWHLFPHLRYTFNNLVTLCQPCHFRFGHWRNWQRHNPDLIELIKSAQRLNNTVDWAGTRSFFPEPANLQTTLLS